MSRSFRKVPFMPRGKRRRQLTRDYHRVARTKFKRDLELTGSEYKKMDTDCSYELNEGRLGPTWEEFLKKRKAEDLDVNIKVLRREYYRLYRNK